MERENLGDSLARLRHLQHRYVHPRIRALGMFKGQPFVLMIVNSHPGISQVDLAQLAHVQPPTLARTIAKLQEAGLVVRKADPTDHRVNRMSLTEQGKKVVLALESIHQTESDEVFSALSADERAQLCSLIDRLADRYESILQEESE